MTYELKRKIHAKDALAVLSRLLQMARRFCLSSASMAVFAVLAAQPLLAAENGAHEDPAQLDI